MTKKWVCKQIIKICICSIREQCCQAQQQHSYFVYLGATVISTCSHYSSVHFGLKYVYKKNPANYRKMLVGLSMCCRANEK